MSQTATRPILNPSCYFYRDAGLDFALEEAPRNWLEEAAKVPEAVAFQKTMPSTPKANMASRPLAVPDDAAVALAREQAGIAPTLDELQSRLAAFDGCSLKFTAKIWFSLMEIRWPGSCWSEKRRPRRGQSRAVHLWARQGNCWIACWLQSDWTAQGVYIANVVYWRPSLETGRRRRWKLKFAVRSSNGRIALVDAGNPSSFSGRVGKKLPARPGRNPALARQLD